MMLLGLPSWPSWPGCCRDRVEVLEGCGDGTAALVETRPVIPIHAVQGFQDFCSSVGSSTLGGSGAAAASGEHAAEVRSCGRVHWVFGDDKSKEKRGGAPEDPGLVQEALATFVRTMLRGICLEVLLDDGSVLMPQASLNYDLTHLLLNMNEAQRLIPLKDIEAVATPWELKQRDMLESIRPHLDERCCTLIIRDLEFVTFRFDNERHREYFAACLTLLIARIGSSGDDGRSEGAGDSGASRDEGAVTRPDSALPNAAG